MKADAQKLAKEIYDAYALRLSRVTGRDEPSWSSLTGNQRGAFRDAVDEVVARQIEIMALDLKLDDMMSEVLEEKPRPSTGPTKPIALGPGTICYYCSRGVAIKWYACADCLKL